MRRQRQGAGLSVWFDPRKREPARFALGRGDIVRAAIAILDAEGLDALSMRRLATALRVAPMSVYHHVANKDHLLEYALDEVFREAAAANPGQHPAGRETAEWMANQETAERTAARTPNQETAERTAARTTSRETVERTASREPASPEPMGQETASAVDGRDWRADVTATAVRLRRALSAHPWAARLLSVYLNVGPNAMTLFREVRTDMAGSGLPPADVTRATSLFLRYVQSFAVSESRWRERDAGSGMDEMDFLGLIFDGGPVDADTDSTVTGWPGSSAATASQTGSGSPFPGPPGTSAPAGNQTGAGGTSAGWPGTGGSAAGRPDPTPAARRNDEFLFGIDCLLLGIAARAGRPVMRRTTPADRP